MVLCYVKIYHGRMNGYKIILRSSRTFTEIRKRTIMKSFERYKLIKSRLRKLLRMQTVNNTNKCTRSWTIKMLK